jgi:hypothetical protein
MAGQPELYRNVFQLDAKLRKCVLGKTGNAAKLRQLRLSLLRTLETGEKDRHLARIAGRIYGGRTLLRRIQERVGKDYALPKAISDYTRYGRGLLNACVQWQCRVGEIHAARRLASMVGRGLGSFAKDLRPSEWVWLADVEADHEELIVYISDRALEDMLLATVEGYKVPKTRKNPFTEVYGLCLGTVLDKRVDRKGRGKYVERHIYVERAAVQLRARGTKTAVWPNRRSLATQLATAKIIFPHLGVIGDFHSHPYRTGRKLRQDAGWEWSHDDYKYNRLWVNEMRERGHEPLVGFIVAIGERKQAGGQQSMQSRLPHVSFLQIDRSLIALAAYRILRDGWYGADKIQLKVPALLGA